MSFVGIDLGNDSCVVAVARRRGGATIDVEVVLNDVSKRETPSVVSFEGKHRLFGAAAAASSTRNLTSTISQIKRLLGRSFSDEDLHKDLKSLPFKVTRGHDGYPLVHVSYLGKDEAFTPTQLLGMLLAYLKRIAEKDVDADAQVQHWCVGIPVHFTDLQRKSVMNAAAIAGLTSVSLLHETSAAALDYSMVANQNDHAVVAFIDVGHTSTQISISSLNKILAQASDSSLGGRDFDEVLFRHLVAVFMKEYKIDVGKNNKASFKLRNECRKMKEKLTSNPEHRLSIDSIMDGVDVKGRITKEEFEQLTAHLLQRLRTPLETAIADAGLSVDEVKSFVLVGAGSRVPAIVKTLADFFGKEPRRTIIASECIARGCALHCAGLKITSKVPQADADLQKAIDREIKMGLQDRLVEETEEKKNSLEAYVYEIRDKLDGDYQEFVTGSEKEELIAKLQEVEDWLYEDGMDGTKDAYIAKLDQIKEQLGPIDERYKESIKRRLVVNQLVHCITNYEEASSKDPKFDHIDGAEKQKVIAECEKAAEWLEDKEKEQALLPKHATPILRSTDLKREAETLDGYDDKAPQLTDTGKQPVSSRKYRRIR